MQQITFVLTTFTVLFFFTLCSSALLIEALRIFNFKLGDDTNTALALVAFGLLTSLVTLIMSGNFSKNPYDNKNKFLYIAFGLSAVPKILLSYMFMYDKDKYKTVKMVVQTSSTNSLFYEQYIFLYRAFNLEFISNILLITLGPMGIFANFYMNRAFLKISTTPQDPNQLYEVANVPDAY